MEDALSVLGDGAWCRVPVRGAVPPTIGHLKQDSSEHKQSHAVCITELK